MENMRSLGLLVGRILIGQIFLISGVGKIFDFQGTSRYMTLHHMHAVSMWLVIAIVVEISGALSVIGGYFTRMGALMLILFLLPVTFIFHRDLGNRLQFIMFLKNMAIIGGLFMLVCTGSGRFSMDGWSAGRKEREAEEGAD